ncbi:MAG: ABC-F family ATP-binding cassette domain-containing protein [Acetobacteraceae bacterium]
MSLLAVEGVSFSLAGRTLLDHVTFTLDAGRKVGLVGSNGVGKTTLIRLISGEIPPDGGTIRLAHRARMGGVAQAAPAGSITPIEVVLAADTERRALLERAGTAPANELAAIHERLTVIAADSAPARAAAILDGLGFDEPAQHRPMYGFSGGWRMRVALAAALFSAPDLLLLDEPTNHLDLEATIWLESWLARFPGAVLLVSHERDLLDQAVDAIAHLDRGTITVTPGGFTEFIRIRTEHLEQQSREARNIAARRAHMEAFIDRFRYQASKARQAQSRLKALARLPAIEAIVEPAPTHFALPEPRPIAPPLLSFDRVSLGYDGRAVLSGVSLRIDMEDRIALLGANGNGKSTLAKGLAGRLAPLAGRAHRAPGLGVGYFAQIQEEELDPAASALEHLAKALPKATMTALRAQGARFGLDAARIETTVAALSGGERARLLLALATRAAPQILILDEPTNHLDIDAREALIRALVDFPGALVLITHDTHLISLIADRLLLVAGGRVAPFEGDLDAYRSFATRKSQPAPQRAQTEPRNVPAREAKRRARAGIREAARPLRQKANAAEQALDRLALERRTIETSLGDPSLPARLDRQELIRLHRRLAAIRHQTEAVEAEWLEALSELEEPGRAGSE